MKYRRMPIEMESPEQFGYDNIDCNLAESSVTDAVFRNLGLNLDQLVLAYGHHLGKPELRELVASESASLKAEDVILTAGAASALFIVATSLLSEKDHMVVVRPNYATNIETPRAIACDISFAELLFEEKFHLDLEKLEKLITPFTKLLSITCPHNPTGAMMSKEDLQKLIRFAEAKNCYLLVDETYRDLSLGEKLPIAASLSDKVISVSSVSKAYGLPGIRMGWLITKNKSLQELFLAGKEQIFVCNSVVDEEIAYQFLQKKNEFFPNIEKRIRKNFEILQSWMSTCEQLEWVEPKGGVVCFPRIKSNSKVNIDRFYQILNDQYKTFVGPGHWFEMDKRYMRIGFGWPSEKELAKGLANIQLALLASME